MDGVLIFIAGIVTVWLLMGCSTATHTPERDSTARTEAPAHVSMVDAPGKSSDKGENP